MLTRVARSSGGVLGFFGTALYHQKVIDHFANPQNVGKLDSKDKDVGTAIVGAPACGDTLQFQIKVDTETHVIKDVKFKAFGCPSAIASSSYATTLLKGKTLDDALKIRNTEISSELNLPPVKLHCSTLAQEAIQSAVQNYLDKQKKNEK
jgi:nitrogen fixation NifU-like protein